MAAKRPTGERPKQLSILAKTVKSAARGGVASKSGKVEVLTPSQAAARAGKMRDKAAAAKKIKLGNPGAGSDKAQLKKAAKKADPMKTSARSHQADLARMSGDTAGNKKFRDDKKAGKMYREDKPSPAYLAGKKAEKRTLKSFK
jgi:hypothetical protein